MPSLGSGDLHQLGLNLTKVEDGVPFSSIAVHVAQTDATGLHKVRPQLAVCDGDSVISVGGGGVPESDSRSGHYQNRVATTIHINACIHH